MNTLGIITVVGLLVIIILFLVLRKRHRSDVVEEMLGKRKASSKVASRGDFIQGLERLPVALSLTETQFFYENADFQGQFELARVDEIEYDDELATGKAVENGRVLRLRSHGQAFEFILPRAEAERWSSSLPTRRLSDAGSARAG